MDNFKNLVEETKDRLEDKKDEFLVRYKGMMGKVEDTFDDSKYILENTVEDIKYKSIKGLDVARKKVEDIKKKF